MDAFHAKIREFALRADRKMLSTEEETYFRMDLLAHERAVASILTRKQFLDFLPLAGIKRFTIIAVLLYAILFAMTNLAAYSKIAFTSLNDAFAKPQEIAVLEPQLLSTIQGSTVKISSQENSAIPQLALTPSNYDNRLEIESLGISAPIVEPKLGADAIKSEDWKGLEEQIREALSNGIVHYPGTAYPGQKGNAFFTGHSSNVFWELSKYNTVFALLPKIKIGDNITINYNQNAYTYRVIEKKEVYPNDVSSLKQGDNYHLTLVTCTPVGTAYRRLIVTAELVTD